MHLYTPEQLRRLGLAVRILAKGLERLDAEEAAKAAQKEAIP